MPFATGALAYEIATPPCRGCQFCKVDATVLDSPKKIVRIASVKTGEELLITFNASGF